MSDATSVLFGLEDEFVVVEVQRIDASRVKVLIEQLVREGAVSGVRGVYRGGEGPAGDAAEGSAGVRAGRGAVVAETPPDLR
jgi:hypothetical protein